MIHSKDERWKFSGDGEQYFAESIDETAFKILTGYWKSVIVIPPFTERWWKKLNGQEKEE